MLRFLESQGARMVRISEADVGGRTRSLKARFEETQAQLQRLVAEAVSDPEGVFYLCQGVLIASAVPEASGKPAATRVQLTEYTCVSSEARPLTVRVAEVAS